VHAVFLVVVVVWGMVAVIIGGAKILSHK